MMIYYAIWHILVSNIDSCYAKLIIYILLCVLLSGTAFFSYNSTYANCYVVLLEWCYSQASIALLVVIKWTEQVLVPNSLGVHFRL